MLIPLNVPGMRYLTLACDEERVRESELVI